MSTENKELPVKYVLFSHISYHEREDEAHFLIWKDSTGEPQGEGPLSSGSASETEQV